MSTAAGYNAVVIDGWLSADGLVALVTLTAMEIVLGVDNVVFIAVLTGRLPARRQLSARRLGLVLALGIRILLLRGGGARAVADDQRERAARIALASTRAPS